MATADTTDIIANEGLPLRKALALHCPFWPEHHRCEMLRIRMRAGAIRMADLIDSEKLQFVARGQAAWQRVIEWLYSMLGENGPWILTAYGSEDLQGEAKSFDGAVVRHLSFDKDHDTIRGPNGQLFYGPRVFSAASWKPRPKAPLLVKHDGPLEVIDKRDAEPAHYRHIRDLADEAFPKGWRHRRQSDIIYRVTGLQQDRGEPASDRQMILRALGLRKR